MLTTLFFSEGKSLSRARIRSEVPLCSPEFIRFMQSLSVQEHRQTGGKTCFTQGSKSRKINFVSAERLNLKAHKSPLSPEAEINHVSMEKEKQPQVLVTQSTAHTDPPSPKAPSSTTSSAPCSSHSLGPATETKTTPCHHGSHYSRLEKRDQLLFPTHTSVSSHEGQSS